MTTAIEEIPGLQADGRSILRTIRLADLGDMDMRVKRKSGGTGRTIEGIAVPYNKEIDVDGWLFEKVRGDATFGPFDHQMRAVQRVKLANRHIMLGGDLIGRLTGMRNDARGLWISADVTPGVQAGDEALALLEHDALDELSIGYWRVADGDITTRDGEGRPHRELIKGNLFEVALEPWGAYGRGARVDALRAQHQHGAVAGDRIEVHMGGRVVATVPLVGEQRTAAPAGPAQPERDVAPSEVPEFLPALPL